MDKSCPTPEPFRARAGTVFFLAGLFLLNFLARFIFAPLMPFIEEELGVTHGQAGSLFFIISLGFAGAQFGSGFVSSAFTHKKALVFSALFVGVALLGLAFLRSLSGIALALLVLGSAAGLHIPSALATMTAMVQRQDWGKAMGVHSAAPTLGLVLGPLLVAWLMGSFAWRSLLVSLGVLSILAGIAFVYLGKGGDFPGDAPKPSALKQVVRLPSFWLMVFLFIMGLGGSVGLFTVLPLYLISERGLDKTLANTVLGIAQVSGFIAALAGGWFADRVGPKRAMAILLSAGGAATIGLGISPDPWLFLVLFLQPALTGSFFSAGFSALSRIAPPRLRSVVASAAVPFAFFIAVGIFPALFGYLGQVRSFGLGFVLAGSLMLFGPFLAVPLRFVENDEKGC